MHPLRSVPELTEEAYEKLADLLEHARVAGTPFIVEGKQDAAALRTLGITNVRTLNRALYAIVEAVAARDHTCIVLTDLDAEGRKLYTRIASELRANGVAVDDTIRRFLFKNTELRQIEGFPRYLERWRRKLYKGAVRATKDS